MKAQPARRSLRCAIYTRVSTDQGLEQDFNSLDAQRARRIQWRGQRGVLRPPPGLSGERYDRSRRRRSGA